MHFQHVTPVHADVNQCACNGVGTDKRQAGGQKVSKFGLGHFACGHRKFAMRNPAVAAGVAINYNIIWRISKSCGGFLIFEQFAVRAFFKRASAADTMLPEEPQIPRNRHGRSACQIEFVSPFSSIRLIK